MNTNTPLKDCQEIRDKMRQMGNLSGVPIEPPEQSRLLNSCVGQAGVIGGGVPGGTKSISPDSPQPFLNEFTAGGYDAIWLLICDPVSCAPDQSPLERVEHWWSRYAELNVSPLSAKESLAKG